MCNLLSTKVGMRANKVNEMPIKIKSTNHYYRLDIFLQSAKEKIMYNRNISGG